MKKTAKRKKINNIMNEKKRNTAIESFINNTHKVIKENRQNNYPNDIKGLFKRLGIE